jgi:hypothetical protein
MVDTPGRRVSRRRVAYRNPPNSGYGSYYGPGDGSFGGLFRAAAEAAAELLVGGSQVASNWLVQTSDAVFGRRYIVEEFEEFDDEVVQTTDDPAAAAAGSPGPATFEEDDEYIVYGQGDAYGAAPTICDTFNRAFQDGARVVGRSADRFAMEYDRYGRPMVRRRRRKVVVETEQTSKTVQTPSGTTEVKASSVTVETDKNDKKK